MQSANAGGTTDIDAYAKEVEEIVEMLDALKEDLERKESLLTKVEETLEDTEQVLETKIQEIVEKDNKLKKIEDILLRKEEDMKIQEEELQTNAALEYLSFKVREEEIASLEEKSSSGELKKEYDDQLRRLEEMLEAKELQMRDMQETIEKGVVLSDDDLSEASTDEKLAAKMTEISKKEQEMEEMKDHLMMMEQRLREEQEDLVHEATKIKTRMAMGEGVKSGELERKEEQLKKMEEELKTAQKEIGSFKKVLEDLEIKLKDREDELKEREDDLKEKEEEVLSKAGLDVEELKQVSLSEEEIKYRVDKELRKRRIKPLLKKIELLELRNDELEDLENQLESKRSEIEMKNNQLQERYDEMSFKEKKLSKREERLSSERMNLEDEKRKVAMTRDGEHAMGLSEEVALKNEELKKLEDRLKEREEFLKQKEMDIQRMEDKVIDSDLDMEAAIEKEKDVQKVKIGVRRLDDLMFGGLPLNSNIFIYGPPFAGKQTLLNLYIADGLKKGVPAIYVLIDKTPAEIRDNLKLVLPKVETYEKKGLLHYVDAYSRGMGIEGEEPNTTYIEKPTDMEDMQMAVTNIQKTYEGKAKYSKVALHSVSTLMAYSDAMTTFRFLQTLTSRCKRAGATALYVMDRGMFSEAEVQTLKHLMNGVIEFKTEDLKNYLRVEGIGDVRTRGWIEYSHTTNSITLIGSFAVDHIR
jgi:KaiC/GvpD/RAD55 family RecA-like ATPase